MGIILFEIGEAVLPRKEENEGDGGQQLAKRFVKDWEGRDPARL